MNDQMVEHYFVFTFLYMNKYCWIDQISVNLYSTGEFGVRVRRNRTFVNKPVKFKFEIHDFENLYFDISHDDRSELKKISLPLAHLQLDTDKNWSNLDSISGAPKGRAKEAVTPPHPLRLKKLKVWLHLH